MVIKLVQVQRNTRTDAAKALLERHVQMQHSSSCRTDTSRYNNSCCGTSQTPPSTTQAPVGRIRPCEAQFAVDQTPGKVQDAEWTVGCSDFDFFSHFEV